MGEVQEPSPEIPKDDTENGVVPFFRVKKLCEDAILPARASSGYHLFSVDDIKVPAKGSVYIPAYISIAIPPGTCARIAPPSGLAWRKSIDVLATVFGADYRGPIGGVIMFNHGDVDFQLKAGDRIAQLIIEKIVTPDVEQVDDLDSTEVQEPSPKIPKLDLVSSPSTTPFFRVKKLSEHAILPARASPTSASYHLSSADETKVPARGNVFIPTDLSIAVPPGTCARIAPLAGLAWNNSIDVLASVFGADYRGVVGVILFNHRDIDFQLKIGDRIAQLIIEKIVTPEYQVVDDLDSIEVQESSPKIRKLDGVVSSPSATPFFRVKKLSEHAILPAPFSAGYHLSSADEIKVPAKGNVYIPTYLSIAVPPGTCARIAPLSGLAWKNSIDVLAGVIGADYRGAVGVSLFNHGNHDFQIKIGDRIAQLIIEKIVTPDVEQVDDFGLYC